MTPLCGKIYNLISLSIRLNSGLEEKMSLATAFKNFAPKGSRRPSSAAF
jgi:hypothetical protein